MAPEYQTINERQLKLCYTKNNIYQTHIMFQQKISKDFRKHPLYS